MKLENILNSCIEEEIEVLEGETLEEAVERQFRRYGSEFKRQFRCVGGAKDGRMVDQPRKCGIRKDPRRVRIGKRSARIKKEQRVRKTLFTKRKTLSKILQRRNKLLKGAMPSSSTPNDTSSTTTTSTSTIKSS